MQEAQAAPRGKRCRTCGAVLEKAGGSIACGGVRW